MCQAYDIHYYPSFRVSASHRPCLEPCRLSQQAPWAVPRLEHVGVLLDTWWEFLFAEGPFFILPRRAGPVSVGSTPASPGGGGDQACY